MNVKPKSQTEHQVQRAAEKELARVQEAKITLYSLRHQLALLQGAGGRASQLAAEAQLGIIKDLLADCQSHRLAAVELWLESLS